MASSIRACLIAPGARQSTLAADPQLTAPDHQRLQRRFTDFWERAAPEKAV